MWARKFKQCWKCGTTTEPHRALGLCSRCYYKHTEQRHKSHPRWRGTASEKITEPYLFCAYVGERKSLSDIAKECGCTRQFVHRKLRLYGIPARDLSSARRIAIDRKKIQTVKFDSKFFKNWCPEMAYVLGVMHAAAYLYAPRISHSGVRQKGTVMVYLARRDPELLRKVLRLMSCNAKIHVFKPSGVQGGTDRPIYRFMIRNDRLYDELVHLRLTPGRRAYIRFPCVPKECERHFIRGCWDARGSVGSSDGASTARYTDVAPRPVRHILNMLGRIGLSGKVIKETGGIRPMYYLELSSGECVLLYRYLYQGVEHSQYLRRNYQILRRCMEKAK